MAATEGPFLSVVAPVEEGDVVAAAGLVGEVDGGGAAAPLRMVDVVAAVEP